MENQGQTLLVDFVAYIAFLYTKQLTEGCGDSTCQQPFCLTYKTRLSDRPVRRPTNIISRVLAIALIEEDEGIRYLCRKYRKSLEAKTVIITEEDESPALKKDASSFTQRLFDTEAYRHFLFGKSFKILDEPSDKTAGSELSTLAENIEKLKIDVSAKSSSRKTLKSPYDWQWDHYKKPWFKAMGFNDRMKHIREVVAYVFCNPYKLSWSFRGETLLNENVDSAEAVFGNKDRETFKLRALWEDTFSKSSPLPHLNPMATLDSTLWMMAARGPTYYVRALSACLSNMMASDHTLLRPSCWKGAKILQEGEKMEIVLEKFFKFHGIGRADRIYAPGQALPSPSASKDGSKAEIACAAHNIAVCIYGVAAFGALHTADTKSKVTISPTVAEYNKELDRLVYLVASVFQKFPICQEDGPKNFHVNVMEDVLRYFQAVDRLFYETWPVDSIILDDPTHIAFTPMRGLQIQLARRFLAFWDGKLYVNKSTPQYTMLKALEIFYRHNREGTVAYRGILKEGNIDLLDPTKLAKAWLSCLEDQSDCVPLVSFGCLFSKTLKYSPQLMRTFRANCGMRMLKAVHASDVNRQLIRKALKWKEASSPTATIPEVAQLQSGDWQEGIMHLSGIRTAINHHLDVQVQRHNMVDDALDQLWRREPREFHRPMKVEMANSGEEGMDQGGVAQEFFRILLNGIMAPEYGIFTIDERTHVAYFNPASWEPNHKYCMLGLVFGLATYNGFTLPVNFPLAFYEKLLNNRVYNVRTCYDVQEFEDLVNGLYQLSQYEGDVENDIMRSYVFSFEAYGKVVHIDISKPRKGLGMRSAMRANLNESESAPLVTNANRDEFIAAYISWFLDKSVERQFEWFRQGFMLVLEPELLRTLDALTLKQIMEGERHIDVDNLRAITRYVEYNSDDPTINHFWSVVSEYSQEDLGKLLSFVTASERLPLGGINDLSFHIQRNGSDSERLPSSMTCFGRLLLPAYGSKEKMERKMKLAIENAAGFVTLEFPVHE